MELRETKVEEISRVMEIINQAKAYMKANGIDQWQEGYPNEDTIAYDISRHEAFVLEDQGKIIATIMVTKSIETTYNYIEGKWRSDEPYLALHRIAVDNDHKGHGVAGIVLQKILDRYPEYNSFRMDTHKDNHSMQRFFDKNGFVYCGIIHLLNGAPRIAYEKLRDH